VATDAEIRYGKPDVEGLWHSSVLMYLKVDTAGQIIVPQKCERSPNAGLPPYKVLCLG